MFTLYLSSSSLLPFNGLSSSYAHHYHSSTEPNTSILGDPCNDITPALFVSHSHTICNMSYTLTQKLDSLPNQLGIPWEWNDTHVNLEMEFLCEQYPWTLGHSACYLKSLIPETTACASVLTLVTLTVERFRAICISSDSLRATQSSLSPSESNHMKRVAIRNILIIWILSIAAATPLTVYTQINYLVVNDKPLEESAWCGMPFNAPNRVWENFMIMSTVAFFIIPLIVITLLYSLIGRTLRKASRLPNPDFQLTDQSSSRKIMKSRTIVVRLLGESIEGH